LAAVRLPLLRSNSSRNEIPADREIFVVSLAHEINNPVESLFNLLYLLEREISTEQGRHYLELLRQETTRLSQIAHSALDEFRDMTESRVISLPELVSSVLHLYQSRFDSHGIAVHTRYCTDGSLAACAGSLRQSVANLLMNAVDAMPEGGALHARVATGREWSGLKRRGLRVTIADTGSGISPANISHVLEPFFSTKGNGGNGIGLSLVNDTVLKHSGVLRIRSCTTKSHHGSVFTIFLPMS
jgi:signal transduction histidine kinase